MKTPFGSITATVDEAGSHEFHGNQYTGGIAGAGKAKKDKEPVTAETVMYWEPNNEGKGPDINKLSDSENQELSDYVNGAEINIALRDPSDDDDAFEEASEHAAALDSIIDRDTVSYRGYLYRGTTMKSLAALMPNGLILSAGTVIRDKGFTSTTKSKDVATVFSKVDDKHDVPIIMRINSLTEIHAIDVNRYHPVYPNQKEVVLPRNSGFRITDVSRKNGVILLKVNHVAP